ncbi:MAG: hypothetical protein JWM95_3679 [Gemmatimonadetes bacterium]|nr:hypothetical protein [Gemmatimonadota bacterium]
MLIKSVMMDVDGVLIDGRREDGRPWHTSIENDLGFTYEALHREFFAAYWDDIITGRIGMRARLDAALRNVASRVDPPTFLSYWFERDARIVDPLLMALASVRAKGVRVYLATNQEHVRASYIMDTLGFGTRVDGIFYSAALGVKKPDSAFFTKVGAIVGLVGQEILLVDDSDANVSAARAVGWHALRWTAETSTRILEHLASLRPC